MLYEKVKRKHSLLKTKDTHSIATSSTFIVGECGSAADFNAVVVATSSIYSLTNTVWQSKYMVVRWLS